MQLLQQRGGHLPDREADPGRDLEAPGVGDEDPDRPAPPASAEQVAWGLRRGLPGPGALTRI